MPTGQPLHIKTKRPKSIYCNHDSDTIIRYRHPAFNRFLAGLAIPRGLGLLSERWAGHNSNSASDLALTAIIWVSHGLQISLPELEMEQRQGWDKRFRCLWSVTIKLSRKQKVSSKSGSLVMGNSYVSRRRVR